MVVGGAQQDGVQPVGDDGDEEDRRYADQEVVYSYELAVEQSGEREEAQAENVGADDILAGDCAILEEGELCGRGGNDEVGGVRHQLVGKWKFKF